MTPRDIYNLALHRIRSVSRLVALCASRFRLPSGVFQGMLAYHLFPPPDMLLEHLWHIGTERMKRLAKRAVLVAYAWYSSYHVLIERYARMARLGEPDDCADWRDVTLLSTTGSHVSYRASEKLFSLDGVESVTLCDDDVLEWFDRGWVRRYDCVFTTRESNSGNNGNSIIDLCDKFGKRHLVVFVSASGDVDACFLEFSPHREERRYVLTGHHAVQCGDLLLEKLRGYDKDDDLEISTFIV